MTARTERNREHRQSDYAGILLHDGTASVAETESALHHVDFVDIQVVNDPALVSRLVSTTLRQDASSWLVLYAPQDASSVVGPHDALVLPFPDSHAVVTSTVDRSLEYVAFRLVEVIRGSITRAWTPTLGVQNIQEWLTQTSGYQDIHVPRFQLIHSNEPLFGLPGPLSVLSTRQRSAAFADSAMGAEAAIEGTVHEASKVKSQQGVQQSGKVATRLARINHQLYERIRDSGGEVVVPAVVEKFKGVMDPETAQFLISAATVARFVEQHPAMSDQFDYSLPGSALCKAVEREAKRSIRWFLARPLKDITFWGVENTLRNSTELAQRLASVLGPALCGVVVGVHADALSEQLKVIRECRNSLAHIDVASHEQYAKLLRLVLAPTEKPDESTLGIILRWKQKEMASGIAL